MTVEVEANVNHRDATCVLEERSSEIAETVEVNDDENDDLTVIVLDQPNTHESSRRSSTAWLEQAGPGMEDRRRTVLLRELRRVQRASFIHFVILCLVPVALLIVVVATVVGDEEECYSDVTSCELEARSFVNALTTRCICDAIATERSNDSN